MMKIETESGHVLVGDADGYLELIVINGAGVGVRTFLSPVDFAAFRAYLEAIRAEIETAAAAR